MRTRMTLGALLAPWLLLTACGGGTSVADPPVASSPSIASTPPPPRESPEHFIRRWAAEDIRMQNAGKTARFREMSYPCQECLALANRVQSIYAAGGYVRAGGWRIESVRISRHARSLVASLRVDSKPTHYREFREGPSKSYPGGHATFLVGLKWAGRSWVVISLSQLANDPMPRTGR